MTNLAEERLARMKFAKGAEIGSFGSEPRLRDIIDDPITRRLMASDGIEHDKLVRILGEARARLARRAR